METDVCLSPAWQGWTRHNLLRGPLVQSPCSRKGTVLGVKEQGEPLKDRELRDQGVQASLPCPLPPTAALEPFRGPGGQSSLGSLARSLLPQPGLYLLLHKPHSQADCCFWSLSGRRSLSIGATHCWAVAAQADTQQSSPLKAGTTQSHKQPAEGTPHAPFTEMPRRLYLKIHPLK